MTPGQRSYVCEQGIYQNVFAQQPNYLILHFTSLFFLNWNWQLFFQKKQTNKKILNCSTLGNKTKKKKNQKWTSYQEQEFLIIYYKYWRKKIISLYINFAHFDEKTDEKKARVYSFIYLFVHNDKKMERKQKTMNTSNSVTVSHSDCSQYITNRKRNIEKHWNEMHFLVLCEKWYRIIA